MRFIVLAILFVSASVSAAAAANEDQRSHQLLRRRRVLNEQQVTLKVNLVANCQVESTQFCAYPSSFIFNIVRSPTRNHNKVVAHSIRVHK
jgi:hypothetical protein